MAVNVRREREIEPDERRIIEDGVEKRVRYPDGAGSEDQAESEMETEIGTGLEAVVEETAQVQKAVTNGGG